MAMGDEMTKFTAWMVAVFSAALIGLFGGAAPACACSCLPITDEQAYTQADAVFVGTVVRRTKPRPFPVSSAHPVVITFQVHAVYKGGVLHRQRVRTAYSSASCGLDTIVGERYLVFADRSRGRLHVSLCGGTRPESGAPTIGGHEPFRIWRRA